MIKNFITFGGGDNNYIDAGNRLINQAKSLELFDTVKLFTDEDLKQDEYFWNKHHNFIQNNRRGYGYWLWKPYIINKTLKNMKDGDILLYSDCGCEIKKSKKNEFNIFFEIVKKDYIISTYSCPEKDWNKMDLILKLNMLIDKELNDPMQHHATTIMFLVNNETKHLVNEWYNLACDYHNIDDTPSISQNLSCFKEHRHDQSIFSLLTKKYNIYSNKQLDCIEILRNISKNSRI